MAAVIINQKDVKRLGKELLKEIFDFLHDEYILTEFEKMKEVKEKFLNNLILNHINTLHRKFKITDEKRQELYELIKGKKSFPEETELEVNAMKDNGIDTEGIYHTLISLNLGMEIDEDLYYIKKAFLDIYRVFETGYIYLED